MVITDNTAIYGGGIDIDSSSPILNNVEIIYNMAMWGGGVLLWSASPVFHNVTVSGNSADSKGGGISIQSNSNLMASRLMISDNFSVGHGGGIFLSAGAQLDFQHSTISNNSVGSGNVFGAGIYADGGSAMLINSIIYFRMLTTLDWISRAWSPEVLRGIFRSIYFVIGDSIYVIRNGNHFPLDPK